MATAADFDLRAKYHAWKRDLGEQTKQFVHPYGQVEDHVWHPDDISSSDGEDYSLDPYIPDPNNLIYQSTVPALFKLPDDEEARQTDADTPKKSSQSPASVSSGSSSSASAGPVSPSKPTPASLDSDLQRMSVSSDGRSKLEARAARFGAPSTSLFGAQQSQQQQASLFGASAQPPSSLFGAQQQQGGLFGASAQPSSSLFGAQQQPQPNLFGAAAQPSSSLFAAYQQRQTNSVIDLTQQKDESYEKARQMLVSNLPPSSTSLDDVLNQITRKLDLTKKPQELAKPAAKPMIFGVGVEEDDDDDDEFDPGNNPGEDDDDAEADSDESDEDDGSESDEDDRKVIKKRAPKKECIKAVKAKAKATPLPKKPVASKKAPALKKATKAKKPAPTSQTPPKGEDLSKLTVVVLKERLRSLGLPVSGTKPVLIARLEAHQNSSPPSSSPSSSAAPSFAPPASSFSSFPAPALSTSSLPRSTFPTKFTIKASTEDPQAGISDLNQLLAPFWEEKLKVVINSQPQVEKYLGLFRDPAIIPHRPLTFAALNRVSRPDQVRVVIFGQDPYPRAESAVGVSFLDGAIRSWDDPFSPSFRNIIKASLISSGFLSAATLEGMKRALRQQAIAKDPSSWFEWTMQNQVMWLNTALTFSSTDLNILAEHTRFWQPIVSAIIAAIIESSHGVVFALWGGNAQALAPLIRSVGQSHKVRIVQSPHPAVETFIKVSPNPFDAINAALLEINSAPVTWWALSRN